MENTTVSQISHEKPGGNTKNAWPRYQLYCWFFTLKYEESQLSQLLELLKNISKKFTFSGEIGEGGYKHWQGCFSLKKKEYFATVKNYFPNSIHLEPCKNFFSATSYCKKEETHIEGPYTEKTVLISTIEKLYPWQEKIEEICLRKPDDRTIHWYWEPKGCKGKTAFCKYMAVKHGATILANGASKDIGQSLPDDPKIVIFNFTRTTEERINYGALEAVKDGLVFCPKYESKTKIFNCPHVVVFSNFPPDKETMSIDRWKIEKLT